MAPEVARLGHVALDTPDLEASLRFFRDAVGLEVVERVDETVFLRAVDELDHHSLSLTAAESAGVDHIGWQTTEPEHVSAYADKLDSQGVEVTWIDREREPGQGEAIRFDVPNGHRFELYGRMAKPDPPADQRSKLKNRVYDPTTTNPIAPQRIDHVQLWDPKGIDCANWLADELGFQVQEYYDNEDGSRWGTFMSACTVKIDAAIVQSTSPEDPPALHHIAYTVNAPNDLFAAHDAMNEHGFPTDGIGQHAISRGEFLYARDPGTNHRIEFNTGSYLTLDPHWDPIAWQEGDLEDRQWIGQITSPKRVQYTKPSE